MLLKLKKNTVNLKSAIFSIRWYPNSRSCANTPNRKPKLQQMPPLMVRKAEWRR
jgi:hypothetical protein